jgi:hypothetical protein
MRTTDLSHSNDKSFISYVFTHSTLQSLATRVCVDSSVTFRNTSQEEGLDYKIMTSRRPTRCWITNS